MRLITGDAQGQCALVILSATLRVERWCLHTGTHQCQHTLPLPPTQPHSAALSPRGAHVAVLGGLEPVLQVYELPRAAPLAPAVSARLTQFPRVPESVRLAVSACGEWVAYSSNANPVYVVDMALRRRFSLGTVYGPARHVAALQFSHAGALAVAYENGLVQVAREVDWRQDARYRQNRTCALCGWVLASTQSFQRHQEVCCKRAPSTRHERLAVHELQQRPSVCCFCHQHFHVNSLRRHETSCPRRA